MKQDYKEEIQIPEGVEVTLEKGIFTVKGEKGEVARTLFHPKINSKIEGSKVIFTVLKGTQKEKKLLFTYMAHLRNLIKGVTQGVIYKLKICASHFPMTVTNNDNIFEVKNFIGEKIPRKLNLPKEVNVNVNGSEIVLEGINKEVVGQAAASIEKLTRRSGFDRRVFQDGIYITEKDGKVMK